MPPQVLADQRPVPGHRVAAAEAQLQAERGESSPPPAILLLGPPVSLCLCLVPFSYLFSTMP